MSKKNAAPAARIGNIYRKVQSLLGTARSFLKRLPDNHNVALLLADNDVALNGATTLASTASTLDASLEFQKKPRGGAALTKGDQVQLTALGLKQVAGTVAADRTGTILDVIRQGKQVAYTVEFAYPPEDDGTQRDADRRTLLGSKSVKAPGAEDPKPAGKRSAPKKAAPAPKPVKKAKRKARAAKGADAAA